jgi:sugar lactone lactonase YvrE
MKTGMRVGLVVGAGLAIAQMGISSLAAAAEPKGLRVVSEQTVTGFKFPESVAYDPAAKVLYVGQFGSKLAPAEKDGQGKISKVALDGKVLEDRFLPAHGETLHKPKGIWVKGNRLWVTDIDAVWIFDLKTRKGRKLELRGITFANDPAVLGNSLYVSDNRADELWRVEPADFLNHKGNPQVSIVFAGRKIYPNGLYPARDGTLLVVGFQSPKDPRGIFSLNRDGETKALSKGIGRLDGVYQLRDGSLLVTDWDSGSLSRWSAKTGMQPLAKGFKGPADFCVVPDAKGMTVVVPDLVQSQLRFVRLAW